LLHLKAWLLAVVVISGSGVLLLLLGLLLSGVRALIGIMPGLSTIVAYAGWKVSGLGILLLVSLDEAELLLFLSFLTSPLVRVFHHQGAERPCNCYIFICPHADESPYR
jgi:hypothetical protein